MLFFILLLGGLTVMSAGWIKNPIGVVFWPLYWFIFLIVKLVGLI